MLPTVLQALGRAAASTSRMVGGGGRRGDFLPPPQEGRVRVGRSGACRVGRAHTWAGAGLAVTDLMLFLS